MKDSVLMFGVVSFLAVLLVIPLLRGIAYRIGLVDLPGGRKRHEKAVPVVGGLAVFPIFIIAVLVSGVERADVWFIVALVLLMITGALDDRFSISVWVKLAMQVIAAILIVVLGGTQVIVMGDLLGIGDLVTSWMAIPFSIIATVLLVNAINLMDGLDGVAGGNGLIIAFWLAVCSLVAGDTVGVILTVTLVGTLAGFLVYNLRHPLRARASVFLGDSGSLALGLTLAWLVINLSQGTNAVIRPITVAWMLALPIYDICGQFARRVRLGWNPFDPDRHHFHHHFLYAGLSDTQATANILIVTFLMGLVGTGGVWVGVPEYILSWLWIALLLLHIYMSLNPLRYLGLLLRLQGKSIDNLIGQVILESEAINEVDLVNALEYQGKFGGKIGEILIEKGYISEPKLKHFLALQVSRNAPFDISNGKRDYLLGKLMLASRVVNNQQLKEALKYQKKKGGRIGQILVNMGYISESVLLDHLERQKTITGIDMIAGESCNQYFIGDN